MTKGSYAVGEDNTPPSRKDTSYRSFICVLLIFLCICLIILLASLNWNGEKSKPELEKNVGGENLAQTRENETEDLERNEGRTNKTHEGIKMKEEEETTEREFLKVLPTTEKSKEVDEGTSDEDKFIKERVTTEESKILVTEKDITTTVKTEIEIKVVATESEEEENKIIKIEEEEKVVTTIKEEESKITVTEEAKEITTTESESATVATKDREEEEEQEVVQIIVTENTKRLTTTEAETETTEEIQITVTEEGKKFVTTETENNIVTTEDEEQEVVQIIVTEKDKKLITTTEAENEVSTEETTIMLSTTEEITTEELEESTPVTKQATTISSKLLEKIHDVVSSTTSMPEELTTEETVQKLISSSTSTTEISIMEYEPTETLMIETRAAHTSLASRNPVCESSVCKTVASRMLSMMNHSAERCEDFYEFACGRFYQDEEESSEYRDLKILEEKMDVNENSEFKFMSDYKTFYKSCLQHEDYFNYKKRMSGLEALVNEVGEFRFNASQDIDLTDLVSALILRQSMPLFDVGIDVDKQSSNFILQLNLPYHSFLRTNIKNWSGLSFFKKKCLENQKSKLHGFNISLTNVYASYQMCQADYSSYINSVETVLRDMTPFLQILPEDLKREIQDIRFDIEYEVLNNLDILPHPETILYNFVNKKYEMRRVSDLQTHFPIFNWIKLFKTLTDHEIQSNTMVQVYFADYFQTIFGNLLRTRKKKLNNALLAIYSYDLFINTVVPKEKSHRNGFCVDLSKNLFPDVWSYFINNVIPVKEQESDNKQVEELFQTLKKTFCDSFLDSDLEWISDDLKPAILAKCNKLNIVTFTPPEEKSLTKNYQNLNITADYQTNLIKLLINFKKSIYATAGQPLSPKNIFSYFLDPLSTKPLTFYANPQIAVPLGLMKKAPKGLPDYLFKTRVGLALAKQLARHFDPTGVNYGLTLTRDSNSSYFDFVHTMKTSMEYSSPKMFRGKKIWFALNGSLSVNERIVDNAAFKLVYDSLSFTPDEDILPWISAQYSREKVFFIASAQEFCQKSNLLDFMLQIFEEKHLPAVLRIQNIMGNSQEYFDEFSCPTGSGMDFPTRIQFPFIPLVPDEYQEEL